MRLRSSPASRCGPIVGDGNGLLLVAMLGVFVALVALTYVAWSFAELWRLWRGWI